MLEVSPSPFAVLLNIKLPNLKQKKPPRKRGGWDRWHNVIVMGKSISIEFVDKEVRLAKVIQRNGFVIDKPIEMRSGVSVISFEKFAIEG